MRLWFGCFVGKRSPKYWKIQFKALDIIYNSNESDGTNS